ncbi:MAG: hypothetical protein ACJAVV_000907 [Alphaproteobacteria bacterium]|jgi:hypothetical protein
MRTLFAQSTILILLVTLMTNKAISTQAHIQAKEKNAINTSKLVDYRWQHRVLITKVESPQALQSLQQDIALLWQEFDDRKLMVFAVVEDNVKTEGIIKEGTTNLAISAVEANDRLRNQHTLLIGLDGGSKSVYDYFNTQRIFADIDAMPMRRAQTRAQKEP